MTWRRRQAFFAAYTGPTTHQTKKKATCSGEIIVDVNQARQRMMVNVPGESVGKAAKTLDISGRVSAKRLLGAWSTINAI